MGLLAYGEGSIAYCDCGRPWLCGVPLLEAGATGKAYVDAMC